MEIKTALSVAKLCILVFVLLVLISIAQSLQTIATPPKSYPITDNNIPHSIPYRDYQLEIVEDTILVYDLNRLVGKCYWEDYDNGIGEIVAADNQ